MTVQQAYVLGDMTRDRIIAGYDFVGFESAFDDAHGVGAFVARLTAVPEPSTGALAAAAFLGF